ncbi:ig-like domain-containing protein [Trichonephila inaurata madagascariensis]|uniref:Ig-like domain-containing protein n=1 Tax=Trichonephila inaurata madagascariensis TaxID=2747483 RepID=A0A8X7C657_9ARAC|nr:ig-like domain-containing protein [Trichonephila inaurata madagascariensis]
MHEQPSHNSKVRRFLTEKISITSVQNVTHLYRNSVPLKDRQFICMEQLGGREHSVSGKVGESVVLPCEVDSHGCGRIYVITWTKHIGDEWRRVYLYSDTHSRPMNAFAGRAHFVLHNNSNAELHLRALSVADEGTYKCDVTYVHGKCPSLTFTKLFTLSE